MLLANLAVLATALFAGAAAYVSLVEHPARLRCSSEVALAQWRPSYQRGTVMQASLAVAGALLGIAAWLTGAGRTWLAGGILLGSVVPFTLVVIFPTNRRLEDPALESPAPRRPSRARRKRQSSREEDRCVCAKPDRYGMPRLMRAGA